MTNIASKRIVITGGTSGLGLAMARALAATGHQVAITGREVERVLQVASSIGGRVLGIAMDVRDETSVASGLASINQAFGGIDMLVNNAGLGMVSVNPRFMSEPAPFYEVTKWGFEGVIDSKVLGTFLVTRSVVPQMLANGGGRVVVISMNSQTMERKGFIPYGPAGAAVEAMARIMAADLSDSVVRVNILLPGGATATGMIPPDLPGKLKDQLLDPSIMADPIVFLASDEARDVHGQRIVATEFQEWLAEFRVVNHS
ncbi:MAG: SDR family NAD(P)-dependent oxidoreductase [Actinomycetota bacterium]|nr:SDR family NAD(P)-dependent oxidoreductase [Actinomycetota bacterium]